MGISCFTDDWFCTWGSSDEDFTDNHRGLMVRPPRQLNWLIDHSLLQPLKYEYIPRSLVLNPFSIVENTSYKPMDT